MNFKKPNTWVEPSIEEQEIIENLLGKKPQGEYQILIRDETNHPLVLENAPFFYDGTPMPTRFWLLESNIFKAVSKLESAGGVKKVQEEIDLETIQKIHSEYEKNRDQLIDDGYLGPKPSGGVGGTRRGVKCLHAHVANFLATKNDVIGQWAIEKIDEDNKSKSITSNESI